jgi:Xaa-Pro dipeptidase
MSALRDELPARLGRMAGTIAKRGLAGAIFWDPANLCYYTGNEISGPNYAWIEAGGGAHVFCDEYDAYNVSLGAAGLLIHSAAYWTDPLDLALDHIAGLKPASIGLETRDIRHSVQVKIAGRLASTRLDAIDDLIAAQRLVKSAAEQDVTRQAAKIVGQAYDAARALLAGPTSERDVTTAVYRALVMGGSDYVASQPYIKSGNRALQTHARWGDRAIAPGDHVLLELGACVNRYHAALMRTRLPAKPSPAVQRAIDAVRAGRDAHLSLLRPGTTADALHGAYLAALERYDAKGWNRHSSGYSFGIAYPPYWGEIKLMTLTRGVERRLEPGMALHVIAGVTAPEENLPHVGLSECVLITENGFDRLIGAPDFL